MASIDNVARQLLDDLLKQSTIPIVRKVADPIVWVDTGEGPITCILGDERYSLFVREVKQVRASEVGDYMKILSPQQVRQYDQAMKYRKAKKEREKREQAVSSS